MKIENTPYSTPKVEASRTAPAKAEEKSAEQARTEKDTVSLGNKAEQPVTYTPPTPKKLTSEMVNSIREALTAQQTQMLQAMAGNSVNQANSWLASQGQKTGDVNLAERLGLPALATTQEGALAAISEGGAYSVDAVATRIFDMAKSMAGDDPAMLKKMQDAVEKGFKAAGVDFKRATGQSLPNISSQTYDEVMKRFEARYAELEGKTTTKQ